MMARIATLPLFVILMGIGALMMLLPASHAAAMADFATARDFFYASILFLLLVGFLAIALNGYTASSTARSHLMTLIAALTVFPLMLAVPFHEAIGDTRLINAWFEMVSDLTTTGATVYDTPARLNGSLHLWRATVGWMGGFFMWVAAAAILAPLNLGGFEVHSSGRSGGYLTQFAGAVDPSERLIRVTVKLAPIYFSLTVILWVALAGAGETSLVALCHAMATLSTSGISPTGGLYYAKSGILGEVLVFAFLVFALSRVTFSRGLLGEERGPLRDDPEVRMGLVLVSAVTAFLFLRHFFNVLTEQSLEGLGAAAQALWGTIFTVTSFMTTTGFESIYWMSANDWSGLETPGLILVGLSLIGGGIATTAGGVKLLRIYALFRHSERELERLVHPHSVGGAGTIERGIRRQGAYFAWIFFLLFALSFAGVLVALSWTGIQFENALVLTVAALSTTGPLAEVAAEDPIAISGVTDLAKVILALAMVLGRLEALVIIAIFNPDFWRR